MNSISSGFIIPHILNRPNLYYSLIEDIGEYSDSGMISNCFQLPSQIRNAVKKRKAEFLAGRECAKQAILKMDFNWQPILLEIAEDRSPIWPDNIVGSISHSYPVAIATVGSRDHYQSIGIDLEFQIKNLEIRKMVFTEPEWKLNARDRLLFTEPEFLTLVFSAKESIFKCLFPIVRQFFDFQDVSILRIFKNKILCRLNKTLSKEWSKGREFFVEYEWIHEFVFSLMVI